MRVSRFLALLFPLMGGLAVAEAGGGASPPADTPPAPPSKPANPPQIDWEARLKSLEAEQQSALSAQAAKLKELTGHASLDDLAKAQAEQRGEHEKLLAAEREANATLKSQLAGLQIKTATLSAASLAGAVDPETVHELLKGKAEVKGEAVLIGGKPVDEAIKQLLIDKPYLAAAQPGGSGAKPNGGGGNVKIRAEFDQLKPGDKAKFIQAGGKVID